MNAAERSGAVEEVAVGDLAVAYRRAGSGPPVLFLHGAFADGRAWRRQLAGLSRDFSVIAWDAPGCGRSGDPPETVTETEYVDYLVEFVAALGLGRPHVVGHSFGGVLALALYRRRPELVRTLVLVSAYAGWAGSLPPGAVEERIRQAERLAALPPEEVVAGFLPTLFAASPPADLAADAADMIAGFHPAGVRALLHAFGRSDLRDVLPRIAVPTLLVWGEHDRRSPPAVGEDFRARIPGAELVVVAGAGHESAMEAPDPFNEAVRRFLRTVEA
jgi:pimeloyl-ACP methyl ester carboxylesterase